MQEQLYNRLISDLQSLGIPFDFKLDLRPYSKTYFGRYNPNNNKMTLYIYEDKQCTKLYSYDKLLDTLIHEFTHYVQHKDPKFKRLKGVMHDSNFVKMFNSFKDKVYSAKLWRELRAS